MPHPLRGKSCSELRVRLTCGRNPDYLVDLFTFHVKLMSLVLASLRIFFIKMKDNNKLYSIQAMRGIAALLVVLFHSRVYLNNVYSQSNLGDLLFSFGYLGVDLFFIISGFIITHATYNKTQDSGFKYISKRLFRIYPAYIVALALLCVMRGLDFSSFQLTGGYTLENIIKSLFFIPLNFDAQGPYYGYSLLIVAWTLTYEVIFYAIFFIGMSINHRFRAAITSVLIISCYIITCIVNKNFELDPRHYTYNIKFIEIVANPIMLNFVLGMVAYYIFNKSIKIKHKTILPASYITLSISILLLASGKFTGHGINKFGIISFLGFMSIVFMIESSNTQIHKWLLFLGNISYSLYLSHVVIILSLEKYKTSFPLIGETEGFSKVIGILIYSLILSSLMFYFVEKPSTKILRKYYTDKAA